MNALIAAAALATASVTATPAVQPEFVVNVDNTESSTLAISFETVATQSSMCGLVNRALTVRAPQGNDFIGILLPPLGLIELEASVDPNAFCLQAFGPNRGELVLPYGFGLPELQEGYYQLVINGQSYGYVEAFGGAAQLITADQLPQ